MIFATGLFTTEETYVLRGQNRIVTNAVWKIYAKKISDTEGKLEYDMNNQEESGEI